MKQRYLMLQPLGWEAIILLDESNNNLILFKKLEDPEWYQGMYRYDTKKMIADTITYKWVLEKNKYTILSILFAMIQEDNICQQIILPNLDEEGNFIQRRIDDKEITQYSIRYAHRYDN